MAADSDSDKAKKTSEAGDSSKKVSHILDEVLEETGEILPRHNKLPIFIDIALAFCLLLTMGSFSAGLVKMYVSHSAEQSIIQRNYPAAIGLLEGAPFPDLFSPPGSEPRELLNQALYLDAMEKLNANSEDPAALKELEKIDASSGFFELAQETLKAHFKPSAIQLQGNAFDAQIVTPQEKAAQKSSELSTVKEDSNNANDH